MRYNNQMRIIVSSQALTPWYGGSAISEASLSAHLSKFADVTVLCPQGNLDYAFARSFGVKEVREYQPIEVFDAWKDNTHWLSQCLDGADIFHMNGHWKWENYFFARLCKKKGIPYILHPRGMLLVDQRKPVLKRLFNLTIGNWVARHAARVIALSHFEVAQFAPYKLSSNRITVLPNGVDAPKLTGADDIPLGLNEDYPFFLYLGRLVDRKNILFLLDAFSHYRLSGGQAVLLLVGPVERDYDQKIEARINELKLGGLARILPPVYGNEKWQFMKKARAVIYPTIDEPFGRVPFEAIAAGAFPIVPDESGSAEYLTPFLPECIYRHQDVQSLVSVMSGLELKRKNTDTESLVKAQGWVRDVLDWDKVAGSVMKIYEEALEEKNPRRNKSHPSSRAAG